MMCKNLYLSHKYKAPWPTYQAGLQLLIEPLTPGLQCKWFIHYTKVAPGHVRLINVQTLKLECGFNKGVNLKILQTTPG